MICPSCGLNIDTITIKRTLHCIETIIPQIKYCPDCGKRLI